jgi:methanogenic corrinoid protein MtbC1
VPALRRTRELRRAGEIDTELERLAQGITRRVLATLSRYMVGNRTPSRERVLVVAVEGDEHTLELQMIHDQLAAAGYATTFETELPSARLGAAVASASAQLIVLGAVPADAAASVEQAIAAVRASNPDVAIVLGGAAAGGAPLHTRNGTHALERIDEAVAAVEDALRERG